MLDSTFLKINVDWKVSPPNLGRGRHVAHLRSHHVARGVGDSPRVATDDPSKPAVKVAQPGTAGPPPQCATHRPGGRRGRPVTTPRGVPAPSVATRRRCRRVPYKMNFHENGNDALPAELIRPLPRGRRSGRLTLPHASPRAGIGGRAVGTAPQRM